MIKDGYAFVFTGASWRLSTEDQWRTEIVTSSNGEYVGTREIDGAPCVVYYQNGRYVAQVGYPSAPTEWR